MSKSKLFALLAVVTLIAGFAYQYMYTTGSGASSAGDSAANVDRIVVFAALALFALFTYLAFVAKGKSVAKAVLFTVLISGVVMVVGYIGILAIGLSAA